MIAKLTLFISTRAISQAVIEAIYAHLAVENRSAEQQNPYFLRPTNVGLGSEMPRTASAAGLQKYPRAMGRIVPRTALVMPQFRGQDNGP
jgi:hypothetical protein